MPHRPAAADSDLRNGEFLRYRLLAREIFAESLQRSTIARAFSRHVEYSGGTLRVCDDLYPLADYGGVSVVSIGKGAHSMVDALVAQVGPTLTGIVAGTTDPPAQVHGFRYYRGGHPLPTAESFGAARAILRHVSAQPEKALMIFLISGGGSAAVECPIDASVSLADVVETYRMLVHSGAPIAEINAIRKHLSAIKGGRLATAAAPAQQVSILVSDVPDDALDSLSSGMTMPDSTRAEDCYRIADRYDMVDRFPIAVRELFSNRLLGETPKASDPAFGHARWWPVLSNSTILESASSLAASHGLRVEIDNSCDDWDYAAAADYLLGKLRQLQRGVSRACIVSGGEVTVRVPDDAGLGGRNQHFALYCAEKIAGENIVVLSCGTDGIDGNSTAAGAVADGATLSRARQHQLNPAEALASFNAFPVFNQLQDTVVTGPTGNNLRDLRLLISW